MWRWVLQRAVLKESTIHSGKVFTKRKRQLRRKLSSSRATLIKMNLAFALPFAEDPLSKFKVLVTMPSLSSSEYLADSRVLNLLNKTLFVLQMDIESDESINGVLREIMENDGFIDAVGKLNCTDVKLCNVTCKYKDFVVIIIRQCL